MFAGTDLRRIAAAAVSLALAPACADQAHAGPACAPLAPTAVGLAAVVESPEGRVELRAARGSFEPGFPDRLGGAFDDAAFAVTPTPDPAATKEATPGEDRTLRDFAVRARRMRYDARGGRASFSGDVVVTLDPLRLTCDALEVTYHRAEGYVDFVATGNVRAEREGLQATAGKAQYQGAEGLLTLTESPRVEGDVGVLEGARIVLDVDDETVSIEEVRGTFRVRPP
ncbi:MAG: hypothetical protein JXB32_16615 [Deltaproteobacteria bacterium]|nr:hypothetical protein [Deltaproteobacteria bacterium]